MIRMIRNRVHALLGRGAYSTAVPVMDGPLQPNRGLEEATAIASAEGIDNLARFGARIAVSSGSRLLELSPDGNLIETRNFAQPIASLAGDGAEALAVGLEAEGVMILGGAYDGTTIKTLGDATLTCPTALMFLDSDRLVVASGSAAHLPADWKHDLMTLGRSGSVWLVDLGSGKARCLADGLGFPYGLVRSGEREIAVSEAWQHRILRIGLDTGAAPTPAITNLPGYPSRLQPATGGGYWLTVFAPRNQMVEFVLRERRFCADMVERVEPRYWIAPALISGTDYRAPLQGGAVKQMGILKPWAPVWSYGLVVRLDDAFQPLDSWHSRADGHLHGVTSVLEDGDRLIVTAKGADRALAIDITQQSEVAA